MDVPIKRRVGLEFQRHIGADHSFTGSNTNWKLRAGQQLWRSWNLKHSNLQFQVSLEFTATTGMTQPFI